MIRFLHEQVITDAFQMSQVEFIDFYKKEYNLNLRYSKFIYHSIRELIDVYNKELKKSSLRSKEDFDEIKKEIVLYQTSSSLTESTKNSDSVESILNSVKSNKQRFFLLKKSGLSFDEIRKILQISDSYFEGLIYDFKNLDKEPKA